MVAGIPLGLLLLLVAAWGIDTTVTGDRVLRRVTIADTPADGLDRADLEALAADLTSELLDQPVVITMAETEATRDPVALGVQIETDRLVDEALNARRGGFFLLRPFRWLGSFFSDHDLAVPYIVDEETAATATSELIRTTLAKPIEPTFDLVEGQLVVSAGSDGATLGDGRLAEALPAMMATGPPFTLVLTPLPFPPSVDTEALEAAVADANARTEPGLTVRVLDDSVSIGPEQLRRWVTLDTNDTPEWRIDETVMLADLGPAFPALGGLDQQAHFDLVEGRPVIIPASESLVCCTEGSADKVLDAIAAWPEAPEVELAPIISGGDEGAAALETLGIVEEVSTFSTRHDCCQPRVSNIHLIADLVRGTIVRPGETFSLNGHVGERTTAKGFVPAGAIAQGVLEDQVGGGVSQFATTIFNAAFFAGMDLVEYQSHSLYFSRYPRGREATVSWPKPDFRFRNSTPYGILIWPTYTDGTITVSFYSTKNVTVEDLGRIEAAQGACTRVSTTRQRTWEDGRIEQDKVFAVYRPSEGLDCNGNPTKPTTTTTADPNATSTTTPGATTTTPGATTTTSATPPSTAEGE